MGSNFLFGLSIQLIMAILFYHLSISLSLTSPSQIEGLEILFNSTNGTNWRWKNEVLSGPKWSFSYPQSDPCSDKNKAWQGITCSSAPNVCRLQACEIVSLVFNLLNLDGTLPPEFFVSLTSLTTLQLSNSRKLTGTIPSEIGSLSRLSSLSLFSNQLTGFLPSNLSSLSQLRLVYLEMNQLSGTIPSIFGSLSQLIYLSLDSNHSL
jgi:Leucine-rich repeat (LRR) protein